jgi:hypothetical protein
LVKAAHPPSRSSSAILSSGAAERPVGVDQHRSILDAERVPSRDGGLELKIAQARFDDRPENLLPLLEVDRSTIVINFADIQKDRIAVCPESLGRKGTIVTDIFDRTTVAVANRGQSNSKGRGTS